MRSLQTKQIFGNPKRENPDTNAPEYLTRILGKLNEEQKIEVFWLCEKWRSREGANDLDFFQVLKSLQELFSNNDPTYSQASYEKTKSSAKNKTLQRGKTAKNPVGYHITIASSTRGRNALQIQSTLTKMPTTTLNFVAFKGHRKTNQLFPCWRSGLQRQRR